MNSYGKAIRMKSLDSDNEILQDFIFASPFLTTITKCGFEKWLKNYGYKKSPSQLRNRLDHLRSQKKSLQVLCVFRFCIQPILPPVLSGRMIIVPKKCSTDFLVEKFGLNAIGVFSIFELDRNEHCQIDQKENNFFLMVDIEVVNSIT